MRDASTPRGTRFTASLVALIVVLSVLGPIGTVSAQTVSITQTAQGSTTVAPGDTVTVEATVNYDDANSPAIDVTLPSGWNVTSHTDDGGTYGPPQPAWAWLEGDEDGVSGSHTVTYTVQVPGDASAGDYTISAEGRIVDPADSSFVTDTDDLTVTVEDQQTNQPPTADAGADQTIVEGDSVTLDASGSSDPDGSIAGYDWSQTSGPSVSLSDASAAQPTFTAPDVDGDQTLTFEVEVTDDEGATDTDTVQVTIEDTDEPPAEPSVSITQSATSPTTVEPGDTVSLSATIDYADANSPAIDVTLPSGWMVVNHTDDGGTYGPPQPAWAWLEGDEDGVSGSHTVTYTVEVPSDESPGDYTISAVGSGIDPADESFVNDTDDLTVTVEEAQPDNQPPTAAFTVSPTDPEAGETVAFDASDSDDPDGSIASYAWNFGDGDTATGPTTTHAYDSAATYTVELTVTDDDGATDTTTQQVTVSEPAGPGATEISVTPDSDIEASTYGAGSFQIENVGDQPIASVTFDLSTTAMPDMVFDPQGTAGDQAGKGFTADSGAGAVGLVEGTFSQPHNDAGGDDGYDVLAITFDDFGSGESFAFSADNDPTSIKGATVSSQEAGPISGLELSRATVTVEYADGSVQETQLFGDGSDGGSQATLDESIADAPSVGVEDVSLDSSALDDYHSAATVAEADQTVTVSGPANADVTLLRIEGELELDDVPEYDGTPGYEVEDFEANHAEDVEYYSATLGSDGTAEVPVTLTRSTEPDVENEASGINHFVAVVEGGDGGLASNVVVLEYDPDAVTNEPPEASFTASPTDPEVGEVVSFDATGSSDPDGSIASYAWDFGDGETASGATSTHVYDAAGTYTVELMVTDDEGATDTATQQVVVSEPPNQDPTADFTVSPDDPEVDEQVTLDAGPSDDPDGTIESYEWTIETPGGPSETTLLDADFEDGSLSATGFSHDPMDGSASAGVSDATSNSGSQSAFHNGGAGAIVSQSLDTSGAQSVTIEYWIQKGAESFSENPDAGAGEDMIVEYLDSNGDWVEVDRVEDSVEPGAQVTESLTLDGDALHDGFQLRFRQEGASIASGDFWHVDDVSVVVQSGSGDGSVTATGETITHTFEASGEYEVTLIVTDDDGATDSTTQTVVVTEETDEPMSIEEAIASGDEAGDDSLIETQELQNAIDLWVEDEPVPGTDGATISTQQLQELIDLWVDDEPIGGGN